MYTYIRKVPQSIYCVSFSIDQPPGFHTKTPRPTTKIEFTAPRSYQPPQGKSAWGPLEKWEEFIEDSYPNELKNSTPELRWCSWGFQKELVVFKKDERHEAVSPVCHKKTHHKNTS